MQSRSRAAIAALLLLLLVPLPVRLAPAPLGLGAAPALAGPTAQPRTAAEYAAGWIARSIRDDGSFDGGTDEVGFVGDAVLALAAAGVGGDAFVRAVDYVEANYQDYVVDGSGLDVPGHLGKVAMVAAVAGRQPAAFGGTGPQHDLVARIEAGRQTAGADRGLYGNIVNLQAAVFLHAFSMLGLQASGVAPHAEAVAWLREQQCPDGGWTAYRSPLERTDRTCRVREVDASALAIQALVAAGGAFVTDPLRYLGAVQNEEGGFAFRTGDTNVNSTALAVQALTALGQDAGGMDWRKPDGGTPVSALLAFQIGCEGAEADRGAFKVTPTSTRANQLATTQSTWGASLKAFPLAAGAPAASVPVVPCDGGGGSSPTGPDDEGGGGATGPTTAPTPPAEPGASEPDQDEEPSDTDGTRHRTVERVAGADRYETATVLSERYARPRPIYALLVSGEDFPDAVAAAAAGAANDLPVLLTTPERLGVPAARELERLRPYRILVVGGRGALGEGVVADAQRFAPVERIAGSDRAGTAAALSNRLFPPESHRVVLATAAAFPDALSGATAARRGPVLLTGREALPETTAAELERLSPYEVVVLGGAAAVDETVLEEVRERTGATVRRIAGGNRFSTAVAATRDVLEPDVDTVFVATGEDFADALAAGAVAAGQDSGVLLVERDAVPSLVQDELDRLRPGRVILVGGTGSVSEAVEDALRARR